MSKSPYSCVAESLLENGYHPVPVGPGTKIPGQYKGGRWFPMTDWPRYRDQKPEKFITKLWGQNPEAGVCVILGTPVTATHEIGAIDFDTDDPDDLEQMERAIPRSTVQKRGARGYTAFYLFPNGTRGRKFHKGEKKNGVARPVLCEILTGTQTRQTVIPPTIHPETGKPYEYRTQATLENTRAADLVVLSEDDLERFVDTVEHIAGVEELPSVPRDAVTQPMSGGAREAYRAMNEAALANLDAWVPHLQLYNLKKSGAGFQSVSTWRLSSTGRPNHERKRNLGISAAGIKDFGTGDTYTPIDLVCIQSQWPHKEAFAWLSDKLGLTEEPMEWEAGAKAREMKEAAQRAVTQPAYASDEVIEQHVQAAVGSTSATIVQLNNGRLARVVSNAAQINAVFDGDAPLQLPDQLVKGLLPKEGAAFLAGQSGAGKTFIAIHLAGCLATGSPFFGKAIRERVGTLILAAEGGGTIAHRVEAMRRAHELPERLPIAWISSVPNLMDPLEVQAMAMWLKEFANKMQADHQVRLGAVVVDTLAAAFNLQDENDAAEAARAVRHLRALGDASGALIIPVAHYGKAATTGIRGSSGYRAGADAILSVLAPDRNELTGKVTDRSLALAKSRTDVEGPLGTFKLGFTQLGVDCDGDPFGSCHIEHGTEATQDHPTQENDKRLPKGLAIFMKALKASLSDVGKDIRPFAEGPTVRAVLRDRLREEFDKVYPADNLKAKGEAFRRAEGDAIKKQLMIAREVDGLMHFWLSGRS